MGAGIFIPSLMSIAASASEIAIFGASSANFTALENGPWTPPQYSQPAVTTITVPAVNQNTAGVTDSPQVDYVFDATFRVIHRRVLRKTSHPVLTGANISDHAYIEPARVTLEIGMSDAMASYSDVWQGASTKSISAWQQMIQLQDSKTLLTLTTRLETYFNMLIVEASANDDYKTSRSLKATFTLEELLSASVTSVSTNSALPQVSDTTNNGIVQSTAPNPSQLSQNQIPSTQYPNVATFPQVPGAGNISSNNLGSTNYAITGTDLGNTGPIP